VNAQSKVENGNLAVWNALAKTDPAHTKQFQRAGGFRGTALKPMWVWQRLTEQFGPFGEGWGCDEPTFQIVPAGDELLVFSTVSGWHGNPESKVWGVGGDKVVSLTKNGPRADDEAFKKAFTDALMNAFKFLGAGADIHMGLFDDNKYVEAVNQEFRESEAQPEREKVPGISKIKERLRKLKTEGDQADDLAAFNALVTAAKDDLTAIKEGNHQWWTGDGGEMEGFKAWIIRRRAELEADDGMVKGLIESLGRCETKIQLQNWLATNGDVVESLDGADSRKFQLAYDLKASAIDAMDEVSA